MTDLSADQARRDWQARIYQASGEMDAAEEVRLTAPEGLRATEGVSRVSLSWEPVDGAIGYLVHRSAAADGPFEPIRQADVDVPAVPGRSYTDTGTDGAHWYAVAAISTMDAIGPLSEPVPAAPLGVKDAAPEVTVSVDAGRVTRELPRPGRHMIGS